MRDRARTRARPRWTHGKFLVAVATRDVGTDEKIKSIKTVPPQAIPKRVIHSEVVVFRISDLKRRKPQIPEDDGFLEIADELDFPRNDHEQDRR